MRPRDDDLPMPTHDGLVKARVLFRENEPRDLFYRAATQLVDLAIRRQTHDLTVVEALAVLLQTWNMAFYRYRPFTNTHFRDIECLWVKHERPLMAFRERAIETFDASDVETIERLFTDFEAVLWPVGAAKSLHLLAPRFFPLWDRAIAKAYRIPLKDRGENAARYVEFMEITKHQVAALGPFDSHGRSVLKALDEYNYCTFTRPDWPPARTDEQ